MKSVLLCGCGNIGFRHLQALSKLDVPTDICVIEPSADAEPRILELFAGASGTGHRFELLTALPANKRRFDLAIIATSANARRAAFDAITTRHQVGVMVLEKVLFQTIGDLDAVAAALAAQNISAYVNCGRRYFPGYQSARQRWVGVGPLDIAIDGAGFGLASNGIHLLDLAEYLNRSPVVALDASGLEPGFVEAKRVGCIELHGTLQAELQNGARLKITCRNQPTMAFKVSISGQGVAAKVDELARTIEERGVVAPFEAKHVSESTDIYADAVNTGATGLTPYADSARQHRHFLAAINMHLGLPHDAVCPIS
jgi:predicted dehydrogenase